MNEMPRMKVLNPPLQVEVEVEAVHAAALVAGNTAHKNPVHQTVTTIG